MNRSLRLAAPPDSYVVRIYRRDPRAPARVVGTVEVVASGSEVGFRSLRELEQVLLGAARAPPRLRSGG